MKLVQQGRHQCNLPPVYAYRDKTIIECDICDIQWKAKKFPNPNYSGWKKLLFHRKSKHS